MKTFSLLILAAFCSLKWQADAPVTFQHVGGDFWVDVTNCPPYLQPDQVAELYEFLGQYVEPSPDSPLSETRRLPRAARFVPVDSTGRFPQGVEGFAGLTDVARWICEPLPDAEFKRCRLYAAESMPAGAQAVMLAVIGLPVEIDERATRMAIATTAHELTHLHGAVDGCCCVNHADYNPISRPAAAFSDACWWYGLSGVFTLKPTGLVWDALKGDCSDSNQPELCGAIASIFLDESRSSR